MLTQRTPLFIMLTSLFIIIINTQLETYSKTNKPYDFYAAAKPLKTAGFERLNFKPFI